MTPRIAWTNHARERAAGAGIDPAAVPRWLWRATRHPDPQGNPAVQVRRVDACAVTVHPEIAPFFGLTALVLLEGNVRLLLSVYEDDGDWWLGRARRSLKNDALFESVMARLRERPMTLTPLARVVEAAAGQGGGIRERVRKVSRERAAG